MRKATNNSHDKNFYALMSNQVFAVGFYQAYLPQKLLARIDFNSLDVLNISGRVIAEKDQKISQVDIVHAVKLDGQKIWLWVHTEHQSRPEKFMPIRVLHYQCGKLLEYEKLNKCDKLPPIISIIYHQGKKKYGYSVNLYELFSDQTLAEQYFAKPILVDLPEISDQTIQQHDSIGPAEMILKYIRLKGFANQYHEIVREMIALDDKTRHILIQYILNGADADKQELLATLIDTLPEDQEIIMTVGEQLRQERKQEYMQQGMQQGRVQEKHQAAKNMLLEGFDDAVVIRVTGLEIDAITTLKKAL